MSFQTSSRSLALRAAALARSQQRRLGPRMMAPLSRCFTTAESPIRPQHHIDVSPPSKAQLRAVQIQAALPMVGFGFMDQTIMIHAGNAIDCTIGVSLGISTLAAAAVGQIVANAGGVLFGETLQRFFSKFLWLPQTNLSAAQLSLAAVEKARFSGTVWGIIVGCVLGLGNLLCIDTQWTHDQKLTHALLTDASFSKFDIQVSNQHTLSAKHQPATTLTICGPDMDGTLAAVLTALREEGYSVLEMSAKPKTGGQVEDVLVVRRRGEAIPEEELARLSRKLLQELSLVPPQEQKEIEKDTRGDARKNMYIRSQ